METIQSIQDLQKVSIDIKEQFIIELKDEGAILGKVIGTVNEMRMGAENTIEIDLCLLNTDKIREVTRFEFKNPYAKIS